MSKRQHDEHDDGDESPPTGERLQRVLAQRGVASRRASEALIAEGRVQVNGEVVTELGTRVNPTKDEIRVDGKVVRRQRPRFIVLNKPSGFITTVSDEKQRWTVMDLVEVEERVYPVGRLDRATQGIILLTNEGEVANRVMHPRYNLAKEYHVVTRRKPTDRQLQTLREGILVEDRVVVPDECRLLRESPEGIIIKIVLHEGLYHVVRAMMESVGIEIDKLRRVRIGPLTLTGIPPGAWRDLTPGELQQLYQAIGLPESEADEMNARRPQQLTPVGGFQHQPKIRHPQRFREGGGRRGDSGGDREDPGARGDENRGGRTQPRDRREGTGFGPGRKGGESTGPARRRPGRPTHGDTRNSGRRDSGKTRSPQGHRDRRPGRGR
jgi:23S rRNA pseudouridine2605 synthase